MGTKAIPHIQLYLWLFFEVNTYISKLRNYARHILVLFC